MKNLGIAVVLVLISATVIGCTDGNEGTASSAENSAAESLANEGPAAVESSAGASSESFEDRGAAEQPLEGEEPSEGEEPLEGDGEPSEEPSDAQTDIVEESDAGNEDASEEADSGNEEEDATSGSDTSEEVDSLEPPIEETGFIESEELNLMIVGPGASENVQSLGSIVSVSGLLFGEASTIQWVHMGTSETGTIDPGKFWQSGPIQLVEGDNPIRVVAEGVDGSLSNDTVNVIYNPSFLFGGAPQAKPSTAMVSQTTNHVATIAINYTNIAPDSVELWEVDASGNEIALVGAMADNGNLNAKCDEVDGDGIFSVCMTTDEDSATTKYYRVTVEVSNVVSIYSAWSPVMELEVTAPFDADTCNAYVALLNEAKALGDGEGAEDTDAAQDAMVELLLASELVTEAGESGHGVWVRFANGMLGGLPLSPEGYRAGISELETSTEALGAVIDIGSKEARILAPGAATFGDFDESTWIADTLGDLGCPYFAVSLFKNSAATLYQFQRAGTSGILAFAGHSDALFKGLSEDAHAAIGWEHQGMQEVLWSGEAVACDAFLDSFPSCSSGDGNQCSGGNGVCSVGKSNYCVDYKSSDLANHRLVLGPDTYGVLPGYFERHINKRRLPETLVYLGGCNTMSNGTLASVLYGLGAKAILGFRDYISNEEAYETALSWFEGMAYEEKTSGEAAEGIGGENSFLFGATSLSISNADVVNPSFESKDATGWQTDGDGRVVTGLGATIPVDGKYMGLISTGLGYTQEVGQIQQTFCLDSSITEVSFYWKFYSEEFLEFCGSSFQDAFTATLLSETGQVKVVDVAIDEVCPATECGGCGAAAAQYGITLVPSDVSFDQGGVYHGQWVKGSANVAGLAGYDKGPVTFTYFTSDTGDSIYDTVILVDKLVFE